MMPTDTVYGIVCDPQNALAIEKMYALKHRPTHKPLGVLYATVPELLTDFPDIASTAHAFLPGPVTLIVAPVPVHLRACARGGASLAVRVPDDAACSAILAAIGPLASTSANPSGAAAFTGETSGIDLEVDLVVHLGPTRFGRESTIIDATTDSLRIVRAGAMTPDEVNARLRRRDDATRHPPDFS